MIVISTGASARNSAEKNSTWGSMYTDGFSTTLVLEDPVAPRTMYPFSRCCHGGPTSAPRVKRTFKAEPSIAPNDYRWRRGLIMTSWPGKTYEIPFCLLPLELLIVLAKLRWDNVARADGGAMMGISQSINANFFKVFRWA